MMDEFVAITIFGRQGNKHIFDAAAHFSQRSAAKAIISQIREAGATFVCDRLPSYPSVSRIPGC